MLSQRRTLTHSVPIDIAVSASRVRLHPHIRPRGEMRLVPNVYWTDDSLPRDPLQEHDLRVRDRMGYICQQTS